MKSSEPLRNTELYQHLKLATTRVLPTFLFLTLLFSEPTQLFGVSDGAASASSSDELTELKTYDYINIEVDSSLAYAPELIRAGLIYDYDQNRLVWEKNMEEQLPIASLTKMMVALITMEHIRQGKIDKEDIVTISKYATWVGGSSVYLKAGQRHTVKDLLEAAMIRSGNDAAYALAEHLAGSEKEFVYVMNARAEELGMESSCFANSTGMPVKGRTVEDNYASAADMLLLARELVKYEDILGMTCKSTEKIRNANGIYTYSNRNTLAKKYEEIDGLKTGYTNAAKYCIVATSRRCSHRVITVLLGVETKYQRYDVAVHLFNNYYNSIGLGDLGEKFDNETASIN